MPRKLKTYVTSLGFHDQAVAAPSMKAALEAWGASSTLFHQGAAQETNDPDIVAATMAKPGIVLRRPVGSNGRFTEHADLPTDLAGEGGARSLRRREAKPVKQSVKTNDKTARKAAAEFEKQQRSRDAERRKEEAARERDRARREKVVAKAQADLEKARREHEARAAEIEAERAALDERAQAEDARWEREREKLQAGLRRARE